MSFKYSVANVVINGVKRSDECTSPQQLFEVIHQSRRDDAQAKRIASLIVYYRISSNTARRFAISFVAARRRRSPIATRLKSLMRRRGEWRG